MLDIGRCFVLLVASTLAPGLLACADSDTGDDEQSSSNDTDESGDESGTAVTDGSGDTDATDTTDGPMPEPCGGPEELECEADFAYCLMPVGSCDLADPIGTCEPGGLECALLVFCDCLGQTHMTYCGSELIDHLGPCE